MSKLIINSYEDFEKYVGQELGVSDYVELNQERINLFADATLDHQWIHVDTEKAAVESPFKTTIAHGYLTLSMLPYMWNQIIEVNNLKMMINYGMDKMKFGQAVLAGQSIRLKTTLQNLQSLFRRLNYNNMLTLDCYSTRQRYRSIPMLLKNPHRLPYTAFASYRPYRDYYKFHP